MDATEILDSQTRELIGVGAAVAANCLPCLRYHVAEAQKAGCSLEAIEAATALGAQVKSRPASNMDRLIEQLINRMKEGRVATEEKR
ncbi:MAG TPA: carboxymuconolactone decarboxylase family protein [Spirochaetia bacterium]|nr:carboxymuconolactone decarboxylase family protein [Spirochaetia bacterium]